MREIRFRGKRLDNGEWVYGDGIHYPKSINYKGRVFIDGMEERANDWIEVDPSTVGQYTGLVDKNGTEIYEGDIVRTGKKQFEIAYHLGGFYRKIEHRNETRYYSLWNGEIENNINDDVVVLGNIYEGVRE